MPTINYGTFVYKDMLGDVVKNWKIIKKSPVNHKSGKTMWECKCICCGKTKLFIGVELRIGRIGQCKHLESEEKIEMPNTKLEGIEGKKIKDWVVVSRYEKRKGIGTTWLCRCSHCENEKIFTETELKNEDVKSCTCGLKITLPIEMKETLNKLLEHLTIDEKKLEDIIYLQKQVINKKKIIIQNKATIHENDNYIKELLVL